MAFPKLGAAAKALFEELVPDAEDVVQKPMFGHTAAFVNGHMFMGTFGDDVILRLPEEAREKLLAMKGVKLFEPMKGRPMREYLVVPRGWRDDIDDARPWVSRALAWARTMPPKQKKAPAAAAKKPAGSGKPRRA